jgi:hypothetical protein
VNPSIPDASGYKTLRGGDRLGLAISIVFVAAGAILVWAVDTEVAGIDIDVAGWIAIAVGLLGAPISLAVHGRARPERRTSWG